MPAQPAAGTGAALPANLSLADLDRVRKALALLSDEPAATSSRPAARDGGPVPASMAASMPGTVGADDGGDDADTTPLPVILPGAISVPRPGQLATARGPFEPARSTPSEGAAVRALTDIGIPAPEDIAVPAPAAGVAPEATAIPADAQPAEPADSLPRAAAEKLDQIKDLLITAEAIGEVNLDRHFERVSQRQRELIREFFDRAMPGQEPEA